MFKLFIVTNQPGVAGGKISIEDVSRVNTYIEYILAKNGIKISETYVCPHERLDQCECMKPKPFFLEKSVREHGVDLSRSFVIGDHPHDVEFGEAAGAKGIYVLTGHGFKHINEIRPATLIASGISEATDIIIERSRGTREKDKPR